MSAILHHLAYELKSGFRDKARLLMLYLFPLAFAVLMGGLMGKINPLFVERMIPSLIVFSMMCAAFLSLPSGVVADRIAGIYRSYKINAVPRSAIVFVPAIALFVHEAIVSVLIGALSFLAFKAPLPADPLRFAAAWLASMGAASALGWLIGTVSRNERESILVSQLFFIPSIMLGGLMMPASILPKGLAAASLAFPATHSMRAFGPEGNFLLSILILAGVCLAGFTISVLCFRWENK
jgi:ABC-2 type transport system permease protein